MEPLQNHLVLANIAKYLRFQELKNFRGVCQQWERASRSSFQKKTCIIFKKEDGRTRIRKFLKEDIFLFVNFKFIDLDMRDKYRKIYELFLDKLGRTVCEIAFVKCDLDYGWAMNALENLVVLSIVLPPKYEVDEEDPNNNGMGKGHVPIRRNLKVRFLEVTGSFPEESDLEFSWEEFINSFPNIEILGGQCRTSEDLTSLLSLLSVQPCPLEKLRDFSCVLTDMHNAHLEMLLEASGEKSKLISLDLSLAEDVDVPLLTRLLSKSTSTLKTLKFFRDSDKSLSLFSSLAPPSTFHTLHSLELQCNMVQSLDFLGWMPALRNLSLTQFGDGDAIFHNAIIRNTNPKVSFDHVQSFSYEYFLSPESMESVMVTFPALKRLSVYLTDDTARVVFREGRNLAELIVLGTQLTDEGITGVPLNLLRRKYRFMKDYRKFPFLGDLTNLWRFVLYPQPQERITDFSVDYGILETRNLTCLDIPETAISDEGIEKLQEQPGLITLVSPFYTPDGSIFRRPASLHSLRVN